MKFPCRHFVTFYFVGLRSVECRVIAQGAEKLSYSFHCPHNRPIKQLYLMEEKRRTRKIVYSHLVKKEIHFLFPELDESDIC